MHCPFCDAEKESLQVIDSRTCEGGQAIRRRRRCTACDKRFTTYERIEQTIRMMVVKKDGRRLPWEKQKVMRGLERACFKRPVSSIELQRIADEVEEEIFAGYDREVPSTVVGELVTDRLRRVDQVAYVRFASVYREFKTLEELVAEARAVLDARHYEVPGQGRLFIEPIRRPAEEQPRNGHPIDAGTPARRPGRKRKAAAETEHPGAEKDLPTQPTDTQP